MNGIVDVTLCQVAKVCELEKPSFLLGKSMSILQRGNFFIANCWTFSGEKVKHTKSYGKFMAVFPSEMIYQWWIFDIYVSLLEARMGLS